MNIGRAFRHLAMPDALVLRRFSSSTQQKITQAIAASEVLHMGELRFVAEAGLPMSSLLAGQTSRARAIELFAELGVWDTEQNSGVLIYVQLIDHSVEIVADRGINARVEQSFWDSVCRELETAFRANQFEAGVVHAIERISSVLAEHFPASGVVLNRNELPDTPLII